MLVLVEVVDVQLTFVGDGGKHSCRVWSPLNITDLVLEIKGDNGALHVLDPHLDSPISTATEESLGVIWVPLDGIDSKVMVLVSLQVLARVRLGAQVNLTFLSTDKEEIILVFVEVEAHTAGETVDEWLLLAISKFLLLVDDELQLDDLFRLELVLHEVPESDTTVR